MPRFPRLRLSRRRFLALAGGMAVSSLATGYDAWRIEPVWLQVVHQPLAIAQLPAYWHHRPLIQISDLHVGPRVDPDYLIAALEKI
jgi:predicted MPP superfamily phosphohydrolase